MHLSDRRNAPDSPADNCKNEEICFQSVWLILAGWFLTSLFVGETELISTGPPASGALTIGLVTGALLLLCWISTSLRALLRRIDPRLLIAPHLSRFVGFALLYSSKNGDLPRSFALPAGWGDILIAIWAIYLLYSGRRTLKRSGVLLWNVAGLADLIIVIASATRFAKTHSGSVDVLTRLPLSFLPTMLVPFFITTHLLLFIRLRKPVPSLPSRAAVNLVETNAG
jgi:hypothetical protein